METEDKIYFVPGNHEYTVTQNKITNDEMSNRTLKEYKQNVGYINKVIKTDIFNKIKLNENGFSFCPEITTKISLKNEKIIEVPISYKGRSYDEGKKINFYDGFNALKTLIKYRFF